MSVLQVKNVSKSFEQEKIIENISLELHEGEIVSLLGVKLRRKKLQFVYKKEVPFRRMALGFIFSAWPASWTG